jgi:hypothetical protein
MLSWEHHTNIRDEVVRGLGLLGDVRATEALVQVFAREPDLKNTSESLVRLGALERGYLGGIDLVQGAPGFAACSAGPLMHDWDYLGRTLCTSTQATVRLKLPLPNTHAKWSEGAQLVVRAKRADSPERTDVTLTIGREAPVTLAIDGNLAEQRVPMSAASLRADHVRVELSAMDANARFTVDHVLVVPSPGAQLAP